MTPAEPSDSAVEAAAKARWPENWRYFSEYSKKVARDWARKMLRAAYAVDRKQPGGPT
mgnify:CR=1 FL=1